MNCRTMVRSLFWLLMLTISGSGPFRVQASVFNDREFAPQEGLVAAVEKPLRAELCLNGRWQFQPEAVPLGYVRDRGAPPVLPMPSASGWEKTPIKIPSPWNVNTWGGGRDVGVGTAHPYWPGSVAFPSYPASWDGVEMGWLRRTFRVPAGWTGRRLVLHFEAVAGECQVRVNGRAVGSHFDSYTPFACDITSCVRPGQDNELLVGVRRRHLFDKTDTRYPHARAPYALGSNTDSLGGIWQDVFLLALPAAHVSNTFIKPLVDQDRLDVDLMLSNTTAQAKRISVSAAVAPWIDLAGTRVVEAPEPHWKLAPAVLTLPAQAVTVPAGATVHVTLSVPVKGRLKLWSPSAPNLNGLLVSLVEAGRPIDLRYTRFGWRQLTLRGRDLLLNGHPISLTGDLVHPFGAFVMSRRYPWAWYRMVKDFGGNAVRLHAQPMPGFYLDLADEMGVMVLDETALFGSSLMLSFAEPAAWDRFAAHYDALILRDRNHPSVFGWSVGNELFAIFQYNKVPKPETDRWYVQLGELALRARTLDPTRPWISCDGDEDLRGILPVWSRHLGHGLHLDAIPEIDKPRMVGESGGTYYALPPLLAPFNGDRAFESYTGRNEALAIDLYQNVVQMARPKLAFFSASEMVWFGLEPLPYGYHDFTRLPAAEDGIVFTAPYREGKPGWQVERIPPYAATLNPGWDPSLPLYRPLPLFDAMKAALAPGGPSPSPWDHMPAPVIRPAPSAPTLTTVAFCGAHDGALCGFLQRCGVPLDVPLQAGSAPTAAKLLLIDADSLTAADIVPVKRQIEAVLGQGGTALIALGGGKEALPAVSALLPAPITLTVRQATMLVPKSPDLWTRSLAPADLYFAEDAAGSRILLRGLTGPFVAQSRTLLEASNSDWSLFEAGEAVKTGALMLYEQMEKPAGAALVVQEQGKGRLAVTTLRTTAASPTQIAFWRKLLLNMGVQLGTPHAANADPAFEGDALTHALSIGRFGAATPEAALAQDFLGAGAVPPAAGTTAGGLTWQLVSSPSKDRFQFPELQQGGPERAYAVYFSFWIRSPQALDDLLGGGPDAPRLGMRCFASAGCRLFLNGKELPPAQRAPADYRTLSAFESLPLRKGWNHVLIQAAADRLQGDQPGTLAVRLFSSSDAFLHDLESAIALPPMKAP